MMYGIPMKTVDLGLDIKTGDIVLGDLKQRVDQLVTEKIVRDTGEQPQRCEVCGAPLCGVMPAGYGHFYCAQHKGYV